jgi:hypothetical protein
MEGENEKKKDPAKMLAALRVHCMVWEDGLEEVGPGRHRIETKFRYPDGGSIELWFVEDGNNLPTRAEHRLTDLGETLNWLFHAQVKPWISEKRRAFVEDILVLHGVKRDGGQLFLPVTNEVEVVDGLVQLGQACLRVADLVWSSPCEELEPNPKGTCPCCGEEVGLTRRTS